MDQPKKKLVKYSYTLRKEITLLPVIFRLGKRHKLISTLKAHLDFCVAFMFNLLAPGGLLEKPLGHSIETILPS